jgi:hypothetical protein
MDSESSLIPLPFATAAIGFCLSYFFPALVDAPEATVIGFAVGALLLYLAGRFEPRKTEPKPSTSLLCPNCGIELYASVGKPLPGKVEGSENTRSDYSKGS